MRVRLVRGLAVVACSLLYFSYVFQLHDGRFLHFGLGDWIDPYFINYVLEHWAKSIQTFSDPASPPMFFPARGTLGYSNTFVLYAPFYSAARLFLHPFQAYTVALFLVLETGALALYAVLRKGFGLQFVEALLLSAFFFTSENIVNGGTGTWSQRASVFLIPIVALAAIVAARSPAGWRRQASWCLAGLGLPLIFTHDFYTGEFALLISLLLLAGAVPLAVIRIWRTASQLWTTAIQSTQPAGPTRASKAPSRWWLVVAGLALTLALVEKIRPVRPTMIGGLEFSAQHPMRPLLAAVLAGGWFAVRKWHLVVRGPRFVLLWLRHSIEQMRRATAWLMQTLRNHDVLAFSGGAVAGCPIFAWIYLHAFLEHRAFPEEHLASQLIPRNPDTGRSVRDIAKTFDINPSFRSFALVGAIALLAWTSGRVLSTKARLYAVWILVVSFLVLLMPIRFNTFSAWQTFIHPIPGFSVLRDPKRIIEVYELTAVLVAAFYCARLPVRSVRRLAVTAVCMALMAFNWNHEVFRYRRSNEVYDRWVSAPVRIDPSCQSFFIRAATTEYDSRSDNPWSRYGIDAMFISLNNSLPTLNGYSALVPIDWILWNPLEDTYAERVDNWIAAHHLSGVCALDLTARTMTPR